MPKLLNYAQFCESLDEVTSLKVFGKKKFHPEGLFSEQIFGPVKNYTCQCGTHYGLSKSGGKCETCGVDIVNSDTRRIRFAKITLPIPVVNPLFYDLIVEIGGKSLKHAVDELMRNEKSFLYMDGTEHIIGSDHDKRPENVEIWQRTDAIFKLINDLSAMFAEEGIPEWKLVHENINDLLISHVIVLPPDLRPSSAASGGKQLMDKINRYYTQILTKKEIMKDTMIDIIRDKKLYYTYFKQIQRDVNELYHRILEKIAKKEGLIRGNILGKRIDFSGRAVITPDPTLNLDECVLPYVMILEIFKLPIAKRITEIGKFKLLNKAIDFVDECIENNSPVLYKICEEIIKDEVCVLNRQPSLHRLGMLAFNIKITLDKVIKIHPLVCPPFNADFDGDQMAVYVPVTEEAKRELRETMMVTKNLTSPANQGLTTVPSQDIVLGIYFITSPEYENQDEGFQIFNECLPEDYPEVREVVDKKKLMSILNDIKDNYPESEAVKTLDAIKRVGFKYATLRGCTMSLDDFDFEGADESRESIYSHKDIRQQLIAANKPEVIEELKKTFPYAYMIESGARGSWDQAKQMILTRGFVSNFDGEILPTPVKNSLVQGLTPEEFFLSTNGCRKGLLDIALNTGTSGYLSRKLIFTCANLQIDHNLEDCGTNDYLSVVVTNEKKAMMLVGRYMKGPANNLELITKDNCHRLVGRTILIRSPILCKSPKICQTCYGDLHKTIRSRFVGIIAAQTLGERGTQLVLRTFHTCLRKDTKILDINKNSYKIQDVYNIVKNGKSFYVFSCSPDGIIEVSKVIDAHKDRLENKLIRITLDNDEYFECSLDHECIMRDGTSVKAEELKIGDSLMPIYFGKRVDGYKTVRHNYISPYHKYGRLEKIYWLSSAHRDCIIDSELDRNKKIARHHIDKNKNNDYPDNIKLLNESKHISTHGIDGYNAVSAEERKRIVSDSNIRRCLDPQFVKKFNEKRNKTLEKINFNEMMSKIKKEYHKNNKNVGKEHIDKSRRSSIKIVIDKIKEYGMDLNNINYAAVRDEFFKNGKRYLTFGYAYNTYPEYFKDFTIVETPYKSPNQKQAENRAIKVYNKMVDMNLDMTEENFDKINEIIYPESKYRWSRNAIKRLSPDCLEFLKDNHKIKNVEIIDLPEIEEFYDLTVDSEYHNFSLSSGIFVHNSGSAVIKGEDNNQDMKQKDIIGDLSSVAELLHRFKGKEYTQIVNDLFAVYNKDIHHVHFECVVAQLMWNNSKKWRLLPNRDKVKPSYFSVQSVPNQESWLLAMAFSNPKRSILKGILYEGRYSGIMDKILKGELIE